jgi:excisionase family DNA binding protein
MSGTPLTLALPDELVEAIADRAAKIVLERLDAHASTPEVSPYLTIPEAADYLRCSRQRVDDLLSSGRLTRVKEGRRTLVARGEIETYLNGVE